MHTFNGVEAISALQSGKTVLCRHIGGLLDFDELNQFPATVFLQMIMNSALSANM